jgi:hypothetical protein
MSELRLVSRIAGPNGEAQLYERRRKVLRCRQSGVDLKPPHAAISVKWPIACAMQHGLLLWVIFVRSTRFRRSRHVRFAPIASESSHRSESTRCAQKRAFRGSPEYCEVGRRPPDRDQFARGCLGPHLFKNAEGAEGQGARCRGSDAIRAARLPKLMTRGSTPSLPAI